MTSQPILIYSKYCAVSSKLFQELKLPWTSLFKLISIDNTEVRNMIDKSKSVKIKQVPCILILGNSENGAVNLYKYEGNLVKDWISKNILQKIKEPSPPPPPSKLTPISEPPPVNTPPHGIIKGSGHEMMKSSSLTTVENPEKKSYALIETDIEETYIPEEVRNKENREVSQKSSDLKSIAARMKQERDESDVK